MFQLDALPDVKETLTSKRVRSILEGSYRYARMGIGSYGFIVKNPKTGEWKHYRDYPDFADYPDFTNYQYILCSRVTITKYGFGTFNSGIYILMETKDRDTA